ncbi:MAG: hypothetical protein PUP91_34185 [Rhizonema sp. PD37]|nr:hypothetical protein [Rhizonema sp. PD37]
MTSNYSCLYLGTVIFVLSAGISVQAAQVEFGIFKSSDTPQAYCPQKVMMTEENAPYYEGGYTINGEAKLKSFAGPFTIASTDPFSVTWVATLKPAYSNCKATGRIVKEGKEIFNSQSHLRLRFTGGKVFLILDMTGISDANSFTSVIIKKGVVTGNPTWTWAGTD